MKSDEAPPHGSYLVILDNLHTYNSISIIVNTYSCCLWPDYWQSLVLHFDCMKCLATIFDMPRVKSLGKAKPNTKCSCSNQNVTPLMASKRKLISENVNVDFYVHEVTGTSKFVIVDLSLMSTLIRQNIKYSKTN